MDPNNVIVTFPELLIWLPLVGGIVSFMLKDEGKNWALLSSSSLLRSHLAAFIFQRMNGLHCKSKLCMASSLGSSFSLQTDGLSRLLCLLNALASHRFR
jgi:NADH:ubiquinone oxidoreductase subunit 4 (subunit M)